MMDVGIFKSVSKQSRNTTKFEIYSDTKLPQSETKRKADLSYDINVILSKLGVEIEE